MKVKIRDTVYDGEKEPVMVILTEGDKKNIASMKEEDTMYCVFPSGMDKEGIRKWMLSGEAGNGED